MPCLANVFVPSRLLLTTKRCSGRMAHSHSYGAPKTRESLSLIQSVGPSRNEMADLNISHGHRKGYSQHGDYMFGCLSTPNLSLISSPSYEPVAKIRVTGKDDSLQRALDARCASAVCNQLRTQSSEEEMRCTLPQNIEEDVDGCNQALQGITDAAGTTGFSRAFEDTG